MEEKVLAYVLRAFEPLLDSPYHLTRGYAKSLVSEFVDLAKSALKVPKHEVSTMPEGMVFMNRLQFGFYSVLARLDVEADYARVERELFARVEEGQVFA